jgi:hypothetical protein
MKSRYPKSPRHCISVCNALLRGELSAVETYSQAIRRFESQPQAQGLDRIRAEHQRCADLLRRTVLSMGGAPVRCSGAWGTFTRTVQGAADLFGQAVALRSLMEGERYGNGRYTLALGDRRMLPASRGLIREQLLPRAREHVDALRALRRL